MYTMYTYIEVYGIISCMKCEMCSFIKDKFHM